MIEHGVCSAISSGVYKCSVWPFLVRRVDFGSGPMPSVEDVLVLYNVVKELCRSATLYPETRLEGDGALQRESSSLDAAQTEPLLDRRQSRRMSWPTTGWREASVAILTSVVSSSTSSSTVGCACSSDATSVVENFRFLRDMKASISAQGIFWFLDQHETIYRLKISHRRP